MFSKKMQNNLDGYEKIREKLEQEHLGKVALLRNGELVSIHSDKYTAYQIGCDSFGLGHFAIKQIGEKPISLGIHTICVAND